MGYANIQADSNFYRQSLNADGIKDVTGPYTSLYEDVFRAITVTTDSVVSVTSYVGDSLSNQFLFAGTEIYGLFSSVTIHSGNAILHLAGASYISEIINQYSASGIPLGFYEEGTQCLSQKISALLTQGVFDDASLVMVPSQYKEDTVRAFKPTSGLGDLDFSRASTATRVNSAGLIEKVRTNLITYSQDFGNAAWQVSNLTKTTGQTDPNGGTTAVLLTSTGTSSVYFYQTFTGAGCMSVYAKAGTRSTFSIIPTSFGNGAFFNLATQTTSVAGIGSLAKIESVGDGWFRCSVAFSSSSNFLLALSDLSNIGAAVSDTMTFAFAQFGTGDIATAYIPTTTAAVSVGPVANVPRLDYLGSTCPRLLLEPQRSNLLVYSEQFNDASWLKTAASITANTTISPDGYSNADTLTEDNTSNLHRALDYISAVTGSTYTASIFCKAGSGTRNLAILFGCGFGEQEVVFNVNNGTIVSSSNATGTITPYGNGWYRCTATATSQQTTTICVQYQLRDGVNQIYQGNGTSSLIIYGAMAELGAYATSYIPTLAATVTRVADFYAKAGFGNTSTAGTLYYEFQNYQSPAAANGFYMVCLFAGSTITDNFFSAAESISIINNGFAIEGRNDGYATTLFSFTPAINATVKIALRYDGTNVVAFVNGVKGTVFSDTAVGAKNAIRVNNGENATHATKQLLYFPSALTDDQLAALTTL